MEVIILIINGLLLISIWVIFLLLRAYLPSYFKKKGENLATKEDIAEITKQIEQVKMEFTTKSQVLFKKRETYEKIVQSLRIFIQGNEATGSDKKQMLDAYSTAWLWASDLALKKLNYHIDLQLKNTSNSWPVKLDDLK